MKISAGKVPFPTVVENPSKEGKKIRARLLYIKFGNAMSSSELKPGRVKALGFVARASILRFRAAEFRARLLSPLM